MSNVQFPALIAIILFISSPFVVRECVRVAQQIDRYENGKQQGLPIPYWGAVHQNPPNWGLI